MWLCRLASLVLTWAVCVGSSPSTVPTIVYQKSGTNATLSCPIVGVSPIAWYYNNVPIDPDLETQVNKVIIGEGELKLIKVTIAQGGWYTCASFSNRRDFLLIVGGEPEQEAFAPNEYVVVAGTRVELPCFFSGIPKPEITWFDDNGNQINGTIDPITKSLVLFNVDFSTPTNYTCRARNNFSEKNYNVSFQLVPKNDNNKNVINPNFSPSFNHTTNTSLMVPLGTTARLSCGGTTNNYTYQWLRNGVDIAIANNRDYTVQENNSSFYCCRLLEKGGVVINTHCVTVFFQSPPTIRNPTVPPPVSLSAGRTANLLCLGGTPSIYDSPTLTWSSSVNHSQFVVNSSFGDGLAYLILELKEGVSGTYTCVANSSVAKISQLTMIEYVDLGAADQLINGRAEAVNGNNEWIILDEAGGLRTVANERVFVVNFIGSNQEAALKQEVNIPDGVETVYVRGRMRQSSSLANTSFNPAITVFFTGFEEISFTFTFKTSDAWQWVGQSFSTNGSTKMFIMLEILGDSGSSKRQATNGTVYFDDISVSYPGVCSDNSHFVCPMGSCMESLDDCSGKADPVLLYIVIGVGGGVIIFILLAIVILFCCCCLYCQRKKNHARPMKKIAILFKKRNISPSISRSYTPKFDAEDNYENIDHQQTEIVRIPDAQSPEGDSVYTSVRGYLGNDIRSVDEEEEDTYYIQGPESVPFSQKKTKISAPDINGGHYTSLQLETLEQQTYYSSTSVNLSQDQRPRDGSANPVVAGEAVARDEGGVDLYLEVLPSTSQNPETSPTGFSDETDVGEPPEETNTVTTEIYDYVNVDLGPN